MNADERDTVFISKLELWLKYMNNIEIATFGAGCFWGAETFFREIAGVYDTRVGYAVGSDGTTRPARIEVVQVDFDPAIVTYEALVDFFWQSHDPTSLDKQGNDVGEAVRSAIFVHDELQAMAAIARRERFNVESGRRSVTQVIPFDVFELAAEHHQQYELKNGATCAIKK
jgi:peptide-methionine (S)-S-oxide reductase